MVLKLKKEGKSVAEIQTATDLSYTSVQGYLPHTKLIYGILMLSNDIECMVNIIEGETIVHRINDMLNEDDSVCGK